MDFRWGVLIGILTAEGKKKRMSLRVGDSSSFSLSRLAGIKFAVARREYFGCYIYDVHVVV